MGVERRTKLALQLALPRRRHLALRKEYESPGQSLLNPFECSFLNPCRPELP